MINIVVIIDRYLPILGGAQKNVHELSRRLAKYGYHVTVLTRKLEHQLSRQQQIGEVEVKRFGSFPNRVISKLACLFNVTAYLIRNRHEYDLILCVPCAYYSDILPAYFSSMITRKPYIIRTTMTGNIDYMLSIRSASLRDLLKKIIFPPRLFRDVINKAEMVITQSSQLYENAFSKYDMNHCELVLSGVDLERFQPAGKGKKRQLRQKLNLPPERLVAITTGRYIHEKNFMTFIRALESLDWSKPRAVYGLILGATEHKQFGSNEAEIKDYVRRRNLGEKIIFLDNTTNVEEYLQASDMFIFPTRFDEGMSNSLLEAMACGLPIIASNIPQVTCMFPEGEWLFFDPTDVTDLVNQMGKLVASEQIRQDLGSRIGKYARENYSSARVAEQYDRLIRKISVRQ